MDNHRIRRYLVKYIIDPATSAGIDDHVGMLEPGELADMVLWDPMFFGVGPAVIFKGGFPVHLGMGETNGSLMTCELILQRQRAGADSRAKRGLSLSFISPAAVDNDVGEACGLDSWIVPAGGMCTLGKEDMLYNDCCLDDIDVNLETFEIEVDDELVTCKSASELLLTQWYTL